MRPVLLLAAGLTAGTILGYQLAARLGRWAINADTTLCRHDWLLMDEMENGS